MPRLCRVTVAVTQLSFIVGGAGCATTRAEVVAPAAIAAPAGTRVLAAADATGTQDYVCAGKDGTFAWTLRGPDAVLNDGHGQALGRHFGGPTWEWRDGSRIAGALVAKVDAPDAGAIPWLLLSVKEHQGAGVLDPVRYVQRLATKGGKAPADGCDSAHADSVTRVPYSAHYVFLGS